MTSDEILSAQIEAWKMTIEVQQHFNDIEWKIRGLAITVLTAALSASALALHYKTMIHFHGAKFHLAAALLLIEGFVWLLFYFVDQHWYHRLLLGAVNHGIEIEKLLDGSVVGFGLTTAIGSKSPSVRRYIPRRVSISSGSGGKHWEMDQAHSDDRLRIFYFGVLIVLVVMAVVLL
jgi:hypothetical protein